jgi:hypothetical protein
MSITYTWKAPTLESVVATGYVDCCHWTCTAVDGEHSASIVNTCSWSDGTPTVAYADLTEATVLGWIWANGVDKDATEAALAAQIELKKNPVTATGLPWSTP